jgi:glutamate racemase
MTSSSPAIGVFDSGVGGLTIFQAVSERIPEGRYFYLSDNANFPYGVKSEAEVVRCTLEASQRFVSRFGIELLIIACNTASTVALERLRSTLKIPVIGVVPAIKPAVQMSRTKTIGLLATPGTIARHYTESLIREFASGARVLRHGSGALVKLAEAKLKGEPVDPTIVKAEIMPLFEASPQEPYKKLDTVVLGCTHFPLIQDELNQVVPWPVQWVDSSQAIAARAHYLLVESGMVNSGELSPEARPAGDEARQKPWIGPFGVTRLDGDAKRFENVVKAYGFTSLELV